VDIGTSYIFEFTNATGKTISLGPGYPNDTMSWHYGDLSGHTFCGPSQFHIHNVTDNSSMSISNAILKYNNGVLSINTALEGTFSIMFYWQLT
jgi:hypothetical protein